MDSRTGLGRFREFRVSNYQLMMDLIQYCRNHGIDEILQLPDVVERVDLYFDHMPKATRTDCSAAPRSTSNLVVLDLRNEETIFAVNRFMVYAIVPRDQYLHPRAVGCAKAKHRVCHRQVHHRTAVPTPISAS